MTTEQIKETPVSRVLRWEPFPYGVPGFFADCRVSGKSTPSRYCVERYAPRVTRWIVKLNGTVINARAGLRTAALAQQAAQQHYQQTGGKIS